MASCPRCRGTGRYRRVEDLDVVEGYKLAPRYFCDCRAGVDARRYRSIVLADTEVLTIQQAGATYRFERGRVRRL